MGALHEGHLALARAAAERAKRVVVSIFVNPAQFAPNEDFSTYPRDEAADMAKLASVGVDAVFAPDVAEMYPPGFATSVTVAGPALGLESDFRPHFFGGVATVVAKLLLSCLPDAALFGEKDYQQLIVVRRMVADLAIPDGDRRPSHDPRAGRPRALLAQRLSLARRAEARPAALRNPQ